ncbi:hypothetical protein Tcan_05756 [Toxocara canis]|uniref:Uncharacterized protein n=1 Tax=Toxocara canis TaxID=6265 RepID=A0A0B2VW61_TOXCA|nr:hypothetical protein Tcan_05756 [Toxocara canis]
MQQSSHLSSEMRKQPPRLPFSFFFITSSLERELVNHILERRQAWHCGPAVDMAACACVFLLVRRHSTLNGRDSDQFDGKVVSIFFGATIKELNEVLHERRVRATTINNAVGNRTVDYSLNGVHEVFGEQGDNGFIQLSEVAYIHWIAANVGMQSSVLADEAFGDIPPTHGRARILKVAFKDTSSRNQFI